MDKIVINGELIDNYVKEMTTYLNDFTNEIKAMDQMKESVIWDSDNGRKVLNIYNNMIKEYLSFSQKMMIFLEFLNKVTLRYNDALTEIKRSFNEVAEEYELEKYL